MFIIHLERNAMRHRRQDPSDGTASSTRRPGSVLALAAILVATALPGNAAAEKGLDRIVARGSVVIGHRETSVPLSYVANGKPIGYAVELCQKLAAAVVQHLRQPSLKIAYRSVSSSTRFDALERGEIDLECGSTTNTAARRDRVAFTIPHFIASSRLMVAASEPYEILEDLNRRKVASTAGTTNVKALERSAQLKGLELDIVLAKDHSEAMNWVLEGRVAAFAMDDVLLYGLRATSGRPDALKIIGKSMTIEPYAIAFDKDSPAMKKVIDTEMRRLIASHELQRLYAKWFLRPIPPNRINLRMKMPALFVSSLRYPTDYVPD
jgi:ABC-type amino acid transport substrate-binding protein